MWKTMFPQSSERSKKETLERMESTQDQAVGVRQMIEEKQEEKTRMKTDENVNKTQQLKEVNHEVVEDLSNETSSTKPKVPRSETSLNEEELTGGKTEEVSDLTQHNQTIDEIVETEVVAVCPTTQKANDSKDKEVFPHEMEREFLISVDEWELYMLGEALKSLMRGNVERMKRVAADEVVQLRQENQRLAYLMQQFEVKRLGKKQALKQMVNRLSLQLDEAQTDQEVQFILDHLNRLTEIFEF